MQNQDSYLNKAGSGPAQSNSSIGTNENRSGGIPVQESPPVISESLDSTRINNTHLQKDASTTIMNSNPQISFKNKQTSQQMMAQTAAGAAPNAGGGSNNTNGLLFNQARILIGGPPRHQTDTTQQNHVIAQMPPQATINGAPSGPSFVTLQPVPAAQMHPQFQFYSLGNNIHNQNVPTFYGSMPPFAMRQPESIPTNLSMNRQINGSMKGTPSPTMHNDMKITNTMNNTLNDTNKKRTSSQEKVLEEDNNNNNKNPSQKIQKPNESNEGDPTTTESGKDKSSLSVKKRVERDVLWMNQYNALKAFHEENGHANVPMHYTTNKRLGHWINNQRQLYRKYKAGLPSSMTEKRIELLEALNFAWVLGKDWKQKQRAKQKLQELTESVGGGGGGISKTTSSNTLSNMSMANQSLDASESSTQQQMDKDIEIIQDPSSSTALKRKFDEAQDDPNHHKIPSTIPVHEPVPRTESSAPIKKRFLAQEQQKQSINESMETIETNDSQKTPPSIVEISSSSSQDGSPIREKVESMQDAVVIDEVKNGGEESNKVPAKLSELQWQKHLTHLAQFKATYGHCNVPFQYNENKSLGYWVHNQRQVYKKWLKGEPCSLTKSRIESLTDLGFSLKSQRTLKKEKSAAVLISKSTDDEQSSSFKKSETLLVHNGDNTEGQSEQKTEKMEMEVSIVDQTESQRDSSSQSSNGISAAINNIEGMELPMITRKVKIDAFDVLWNRRLGELRDFHLDNGHSDVPSNYEPNKPLGIWAMNQRQQYRKYKNGEKSSLTPQRIAALETLHFRWYLGKGTRGKDKAGRKAGKSKSPIQKSSKIQKAITKKNDAKFSHCGLSAFTDDLISIILSYLPCIRSVVSLCSTSKRFLRILWSIHMEKMCKTLYIKKYGFEGLNLHNDTTPYFWKKAWYNIYCFRKALRSQAILDEVIVDSQNEGPKQRNRLGILSPNEEDEAIFYDNPIFAPTNLHEHSLGYFGLSKFYVKIPSSLMGGGDYHKEFCAVWGDFNGLRIMDSPISQGFNYKMQCHSVGENGFGQILTVLTPPMKHSSLLFPCIYLGCASGSVLAVSARCDPANVRFHITSVCFSHSNEITALAWLPSRTKSCMSEFLVSGGCDGNIYLYPDALSIPKNFNLNNRVLCCTNSNQTPILSLATCKIESQDHWVQVLFTGDSDGNIILWNSQPLPLDERLRTLPTFSSIKIVNSSDHCRITSLKVVNDNTLIAGDTSGNVRVWDIVQTETDIVHNGRKVLSQPSPDLSILFKIPAAHGGTIEKIEVIGNVLLTTGGSDGFVRGWELKQGDLIGSVSCHPGVLPHHLNQGFVPSLKSSVVGFLFTDCSSTMTLCRDGSLHVWNYGAVSNQEVNFHIRKLSWDQTTQEIECGVIPAAAVLSNLAGTTTSALLIPHSNPPAKALGLQALKKIMTCDENPNPTKEQKNLRDRMRLAIIKAAYEHASNSDWQKFPETPFIGADGKVYRYIKKAFSTFSGMRPCRQCKRSNRGAYKCRLQLKHDSADVDDPGHNSLNTLRSVFHYDNKAQFDKPSSRVQEDVQYQGSKSNVQPNPFPFTASICSSEHKKGSTQIVNEPSATTWQCHKCDRINLEKNKRCPSCSAWKGGKRNSFGNNIKKNKKQKKKFCTFCTHANDQDNKVCEMCHELFPEKSTDTPYQETVESKDSKEEIKEPNPVEDSSQVVLPNVQQNEIPNCEWKCHKCARVNPRTSKRCKSCLSWKGGTRQLTFTKRKNEEKGDAP